MFDEEHTPQAWQDRLSSRGLRPLLAELLSNRVDVDVELSILISNDKTGTSANTNTGDHRIASTGH
jgi:hypothetical protein